MTTKKYKVGDKVWLASYRREEARKPCPICFIAREVTLILGNGDEVTLPCSYCAPGYNPPAGFVTEYEMVVGPKPYRITEVRTVQGLEVETVEYMAGCYCLSAENTFETEEAAIERSEELRKKEVERQENRIEFLKKDKKKSFAWNAGYHLREAKRNRKDMERHERQAVLCKARSPKEGDK